MHVEPDARGAVDERDGLLARMREVLDRAELPPPRGGGLRHPAAFDAVHTTQRALRSGPLDPDRREALTLLLHRLPAPVFGPADPQDHLRRSVARALRSAPDRAGADGLRAASEAASWRDAERESLAAAVALLARVWPACAAEARETVTEIALLDGGALSGFTDFTVHGAIFVHRGRLRASAAGLPGAVRFAEALVHESAHTRCNAAAVAEPFLLPERAPASAGRPGEVLVATPLRADPRPLTGLFRQTVVLARSVQFYRRIPDRGPAVEARHDQVLGSARRAVAALNRHSRALTAPGRAVLAECAEVLGNPL
ncbi:aKG-HExxH-type peptide beta-hydroxylase [Streptomyces sp. NPDC014894]|uniref:aKG-HExxH-type peptide beta-hydroxylase n=1 Tax=unclassified Streptomyces TaxID=2593676 RepID=UPI0036FFEA28